MNINQITSIYAFLLCALYAIARVVLHKLDISLNTIGALMLLILVGIPLLCVMNLHYYLKIKREKQ